MWDIVDLDDEAIEEYASNELLGQFLSNTVFRTGILCVILFNSILIAVETDQELVSITTLKHTILSYLVDLLSVYCQYFHEEL